MKTKEELSKIKEEVEKLDKKLHDLTEEELEQVTGGIFPGLQGLPGPTCYWSLNSSPFLKKGEPK